MKRGMPKIVLLKRCPALDFRHAGDTLDTRESR
jgi:hypothetical protein